LILGGCHGAEAPVTTALEVSGGGDFTVVAGQSFQSFVTATVNANHPVFTITDIADPPSGPALENVAIDNGLHPGLLTADVPVTFVGPVTVTVRVTEATAANSREVLLTLETIVTTQADFVDAAADGSLSLTCTWVDFADATLVAPAGFVPEGTLAEFIIIPASLDPVVDKLGIRLAAAPQESCTVTLPAALFSGSVVPDGLEQMMASPLDGGMWEMAAVDIVDGNAVVTLLSAAFGSGVPTLGGDPEYGVSLDFVGLGAAGLGESLSGYIYDFSGGAAAGILLTGDPYVSGGISRSAEIVINNGVVSGSQTTDWATLEATLDGLDDLAILVPGFNLFGGLTHPDWYSTNSNSRDALTTWLLKQVDDPTTNGQFGGVLVIAYDTWHSLDDLHGWPVDLPGRGTVSNVIELVSYLMGNQPAAGNSRTWDVVCHSMGGLVARDVIMQRASFRNRVQRFVTLATPHLGTIWGGISLTNGGHDMHPGSDYLDYLNGAGSWDQLVYGQAPECWALGGSTDWVVSYPSDLPGKYRTRRRLIDGAGHSSVHTDLTTVREVHAGTSDQGADPANSPAEYMNVGSLLSSILEAYAGMALVPAGTFSMGRHVDPGFPNELPLHDVTLSAFYMDVYEVTNQKYADYLTSAYALGEVTVISADVFQVGGAGQSLCRTVGSSTFTRITWDGSSFGVTAGKEQDPLVEVSWYGACTYSNWRSAQSGLVPCYNESTWACNFNASGYRLPTEAEWEYAARGGHYSPYQIYPWHPWGDTLSPSRANYFDSEHPWWGLGLDSVWSTPVGYYDGNQVIGGVANGSDMVNGFGLYDMSGNVSEWCWDWYDPAYYYSSPGVNPTGPTTGSLRVGRGGSWGHHGSPVSSLLRSAVRNGNNPSAWANEVGFRVLAVR
jgi:formylglycine-generating enzyme required for sulfatase activity